MYLNGVLYLHGRCKDGHDKVRVLVKGAVLGYQQDQGQHKRDHLVVTELGREGRENTLVHHTLQK